MSSRPLGIQITVMALTGIASAGFTTRHGTRYARGCNICCPIPPGIVPPVPPPPPPPQVAWATGTTSNNTTAARSEAVLLRMTNGTAVTADDFPDSVTILDKHGADATGVEIRGS